MNIQHKLIKSTETLLAHTVCMTQVGKYANQIHFNDSDTILVQVTNEPIIYEDGFLILSWEEDGFDIAVDRITIRPDLTPCEGCYPNY